MITRFQVENYKALRNVALDLTPIHALIGPNDSGKTSILNALSALSRTTDYELGSAFAGAWDGQDLVWHGSAEGTIGLAVWTSPPDSWQYSLVCRFPRQGREVRVEREEFITDVRLDFPSSNHSRTLVYGVCRVNQGATAEQQIPCRAVYKALSGSQIYRFNPRYLALPAALDSRRQFRMNIDGFGLAVLLDDILGYDRKRFDQLESRFCGVFPEINSIKLISQKAYQSPGEEIDQVTKLQHAEGKGIFFGLNGHSQLVPAAQASEGVLLVLGFLALLYSPDHPRLILVEEPENGIHPRRLQDVLNILRELVAGQTQTQVLFTTHSPYAVDLFEPREVTLCTKRGDGSVELTRLSESKTVREQLPVFSLGEIWTAEGDQDLAKSHAASAS